MILGVFRHMDGNGLELPDRLDIWASMLLMNETRWRSLVWVSALEWYMNAHCPPIREIVEWYHQLWACCFLAEPVAMISLPVRTVQLELSVSIRHMPYTFCLSSLVTRYWHLKLCYSSSATPTDTSSVYLITCKLMQLRLLYNCNISEQTIHRKTLF